MDKIEVNLGTHVHQSFVEDGDHIAVTDRNLKNQAASVISGHILATLDASIDFADATEFFVPNTAMREIHAEVYTVTKEEYEALEKFKALFNPADSYVQYVLDLHKALTHG